MSGYRFSTERLERTDDLTGKHEFWIGEVQGRTVTIHFGKVGTQGHRASREFKTHNLAKEFLIKRQEHKLREGYHSV
ncbi:MAG: WGR domain-containing protein [Candidatus Thorarchaeota archaeon]